MTAVEPGTTVLSGTTPPDPNIGAIGDYWIDREHGYIYGPKQQVTGWGTGYTLAGSTSPFALEGALDGEVITYDAVTDEWVPAPVRYTHVQAAASTTWSVTHNLGARPGGVTVVDSADTVVFGDVSYLSDNALTISFSAAFGGKAYIS